MREQHTSATIGRLRRTLAAALGLLVGTGALVLPAAPAAADVVPQSRICSSLADDAATPVFGKAFTQLYTPAAPGTDLGLDTKASAFPPTTGTYATATSAFYSSYAPGGYGDSTVYRGELAIGAQNITDASDSTVTITLPYAQRLQFTVGGLDAPSTVDVTASGPGGVVVPSGAARSADAGSATAAAVGNVLRVGPSTAYANNGDADPQKAVDVWFDRPVTSITLHQYGDGPGNDGGYIITPALGCQSGTVSASDATATATDVTTDGAGGASVTYEVPVATTVTNTSGTDDMQLLPAVRSDLAARVQALGGTLDGIASSGTGACALPADAATSGLLTASTAALAPGSACTQTATATVTLPLDADPRSITTTSTLASSTDDTASRTKGTASAAITFPGVRAGLTVDAAGTTEALPSRVVERRFTVTSTGPDPAGRATVRLDAPNGFPASACSVSGVEPRPTCAELLSGDAVTLGTVPAGATRTVLLRGTIPSGTPAGTAYPVTATVASPADPTGPHDAGSTLRVVPLNAPVFTSPASGATTTDATPVIRGAQAVEGAVVTVFQGPTAMCTATADSGGYWSCVPSPRFAYGPVNLTASQSYGGITSGPAALGFTVRQPSVPPTTQPGGSAPVPGTPSGPANGGSTPSGGSGGSGTSGGSGNTSGAIGPASPSTPATPATPPSDDGAAGGSGSAGPAGPGGSGAGGGDASGALPMDLRFGTQRIMPGTAADMRGTLGPNASGATVAITFSARMSTGMVYRNVDVEVDEQPVDCSVATTTFSCLIPLDPGEQADVAIRVFADAVNAPDTAVQQIQVASNRSSQANAMTVTTAVAKGETEASQLADQSTTFNVTEFPGAMVPLLAMLLFALAATVAGRRATGGSPTAPVATGPPPGADPPGGTTASSPIRPDDQSGSNR
ncbi:hypothetical protein ACIPJ2_05670 [Curtobacterium sp. NPDC090217]|uniref:hypothetical protein n=1 Tax=Curtobacterium sp. NPDC090217 TaxID=3363970 RepID=UPI00382B58C6